LTKKTNQSKSSSKNKPQQLQAFSPTILRNLNNFTDLCATLRAIFFPHNPVHLTCEFLPSSSLFDASSTNLIPVNDRKRVILVRTQYPEPRLKLTTQTLALNSWLQRENLDQDGLPEALLKQRVTLDTLHLLKDSDLIQMGITPLGLRYALLSAAKKVIGVLLCGLIFGGSIIRRSMGLHRLHLLLQRLLLLLFLQIYLLGRRGDWRRLSLLLRRNLNLCQIRSCLLLN